MKNKIEENNMQSSEKIAAKTVIAECNYNHKHGITGGKYEGGVIYTNLSSEEYSKQNKLLSYEEFVDAVDTKIKEYMSNLK